MILLQENISIFRIKNTFLYRYKDKRLSIKLSKNVKICMVNIWYTDDKTDVDKIHECFSNMCIWCFQHNSVPARYKLVLSQIVSIGTV